MPAQASPDQLIAAGPTSNTSTDKLVQNLQERINTTNAPAEPKETPSTLDDIPFDDSKFTELKPVEPTKLPKELEKAKEEAKEIKEKEVVELPQQTAIEPEVKPLKTVPKEIDLSSYDETEQGLLKKMANDARQFVTSRLTELKDVKIKVKDLETKLAEASKGPKIEQEGMYLLDREYQQSVMSIDRISSEASAWEQALAQIDGGEEKVLVPVGYNQDGSFAYQEQAPSTQLRASIIRKLTEAQGYIDKHKSRANHIQSTYKERMQERFNAVKEYEDYVWPEFADPKVAEANPAIKAMKSFLEKSGFGDNILANAMAKMYAFSQHVSKENEELKAKVNVKEAVKEVKTSTGPNGSEINTGRSGSNNVIDYNNKDEIPFDPEAFEKRKG